MAVTYTFAQIKTEIAENIGYDDGSGTILTGKDVTETIIGKYVNQVYYDLVTLLASKNKEDYEVTSYGNFYKTSGTVTTASSTTLTASVTGNFNTGMVGDTIYNNDTGTSAVIDSYTGTSEVEMDASISDWSAGDTIYILGTEFVLGGNATDAVYVTEVNVKYSSSVDYFTSCGKRNKNAIHRLGSETYNTNKPYWYNTTVQVSGVGKKAVGVIPEPTIPLSKAMEIKYIQMPDKLSADGDIPELPLGSQHLLIPGGTIKALRKLRRLNEVTPYIKEYNEGTGILLSTYSKSKVQPQRGEKTNYYLDLRRRNR